MLFRIHARHSSSSLGALLLVMGFSSAYANAPAAGAGAPPPPKVSVIEVQTQTLRPSVVYPAQIQAVQRVEVRPQISGMLASVNFNDGDWVEKGQLLYTIDRRPFAAEVAAAEAAVAQAEASLRLATKEQERGNALAPSQTLSREAIEQRNTAKQVGRCQPPRRASSPYIGSHQP